MRRLILSSSAVIMIALVGSAKATDCNAISLSLIETMICSDSITRTLDDKLTTAWNDAKKSSSNVAQLIVDEQAWVKIRNQCKTYDCLDEQYNIRIDQLEAVVKGSMVNPPTIDQKFVEQLNDLFGEKGINTTNIKVVEGYLASRGWILQSGGGNGTGSNRCYYTFHKNEFEMLVRTYCDGEGAVIEIMPISKIQ